MLPPQEAHTAFLNHQAAARQAGEEELRSQWETVLALWQEVLFPATPEGDALVEAYRALREAYSTASVAAHDAFGVAVAWIDYSLSS